MDSCDVLIVGGGPAGSSCAWGLRNSGLDVAIVDKQVFPRDKICGGWITPPVLTALEIDLADYGCGRVLQPIRGFRTGCIAGRPPRDTDYGRPVSYGIRRREFDHYLLNRCSARVYEGANLSSLERSPDGWIVNGNMRARLVVGAGGHFCPVARQFSPKRAETAVVAQETEFEMDTRQQAACRVRGEIPELYFCSDMKGYGWCFRKGNVLNIGLGRADSHGLPEHVSGFLRFLAASTGLDLEIPPLKGHAYLLYGTSPRPIAGDGFLLIGAMPPVSPGRRAGKVSSPPSNLDSSQPRPFCRLAGTTWKRDSNRTRGGLRKDSSVCRAIGRPGSGATCRLGCCASPPPD